MDRIRIRYAQMGKAAWISHLDMMRMLQRALNRAGVPIRYSEGFNPHALISILLPLSVGTESLCQLADIRVREEIDLASLPRRLSAVMPEGLTVEGAYEDGAKPAVLKWMRFETYWTYRDGVPPEAEAALGELFSRPSLMVLRRTKRGEGPFDLAGHVRDVRVRATGPDALHLEALCSVNEPVVNPELFLKAAAAEMPALAPTSGRFRRLAFFQEDGAEFR